MDITLGQLAVFLEGNLLGGGADAIISGVAGYDTVTEHEVTFVTDARHLAAAEESPALAIITPPEIETSCKPLIQVRNPRAAFAKTLSYFDWRRRPLPGVDLTAIVAQSAMIHGRAHIGPLVTVGQGAYIGDDCVIHAHAVIGDHVEIDAGTIVYPQVTIYPRCTIGKRVIIHAGTVIGADGLGFNLGAGGWEKIPHLGSVIIDDDVEIGANVTIDRATTGQTVIGCGTKIDNMVHIAHNVHIGAHCMIVAQVGIAGSATLGDGVILAAQAGVSDHKQIGAGAQISARAGITRNVPAGAIMSGFHAQPHKHELRLEAALRRVPELLDTIKQLERRLVTLENREITERE